MSLVTTFWNESLKASQVSAENFLFKSYLSQLMEGMDAYDYFLNKIFIAQSDHVCDFVLANVFKILYCNYVSIKMID